MRSRPFVTYRRRLLATLAVTLVLIAGVAPLAVHAQGPIDVELTASPSEVTVGDVIELTLRVTHPEGYQVAPVVLPREWGDLEVMTQTELETSGIGDGTEVTVQTIEAAVYSPGVFETPEITVTVRDQAGRSFEEQAPRASLRVVSVLQDGDDTLRDIRAQATLPGPAIWPWIVGGLLLALLAAIAGWALYRKLRSDGVPPAEPAPVLDPRSPYEIVVGELDRIASLRLPEARRFKEHYTLVSDALRMYMTALYRVPALDLTTVELAARLSRLNVELEHVEREMRLLDECDLVKFARYAPEIVEAQQIVPRGRDLVELTHIPVEMTTALQGATPGEAMG